VFSTLCRDPSPQTTMPSGGDPLGDALMGVLLCAGAQRHPVLLTEPNYLSRRTQGRHTNLRHKTYLARRLPDHCYSRRFSGSAKEPCHDIARQPARCIVP